MAATSKPDTRRKKKKTRAQGKTAPKPLAPESLDDLMAAVAAVQGGKAAAGTAPDEAPAKKPSLWKAHRLGTVAAPFAWTAGADFAAGCFRCAVHWSGAGSDAALAGGLLFLAAAAWKTVTAFLNGTGRAKGRAVAGWVAASAWGQIAIWVTPAGPDGIVQITAVIGGMIIGSGHLFAHRQQELPRLRRDVLPAAALPAGEDERAALLRRRLVEGSAEPGRGRAPWHKCEIQNLHDVDGGFTFEVVADPETNITYDVIAAQATAVASLFDIPRGQVMADEGSSARRALFTVLTATALFADPYRWDGKSTYDPSTGAIREGRYGDETAAHWRIHAPGSGMWGGAIYGVQGTGKSGAMHKIAAETGIAAQCPACGAHRPEDSQCGGCRPSRLFALILGDPQRQPFSVWKGKADLTFWGPAACCFQQRFLREVLDESSAAKGTETYTDKKGRLREGKGWFDPSPDSPGIVAITDEWPDVVSFLDPASPLSGAQAADDMEKLNAKGRKAGIGEIIAAQMPDAPWTGDSRANRELLKGFNTIAYRVDGQSKGMLGIKGNAVDLPQMYGCGYIGGMDDRSAAPYRTDDFPEDAADGVDVLDKADEIAALPITFSPALQTVMDRYGFKRGDVITDERVKQLAEETRRREDGEPAPATAVPAMQRGPVSASVVTAVRAALADHAASADAPAQLYDLMAATGLSLGDAGKALAVLAESRDAIEVAPGEWRTGPGDGQMKAAAL